ncbi:hypothetical protein KM043_006325 [Ampulex compressa]|nr:hypothetical protein KM043_006325 [Ampulex compressa]
MPNFRAPSSELKPPTRHSIPNEIIDEARSSHGSGRHERVDRRNSGTIGNFDLSPPPPRLESALPGSDPRGFPGARIEARDYEEKREDSGRGDRRYDGTSLEGSSESIPSGQERGARKEAALAST